MGVSETDGVWVGDMARDIEITDEMRDGFLRVKWWDTWRMDRGLGGMRIPRWFVPRPRLAVRANFWA